MCTVTFIKVQGQFFLTSSRDEKLHRKQALPPDAYSINDVLLLFPKDTDAGGTWIALNEHSGAAVLLNGAFHFHESQPPYRRSRGLVLIDLLGATLPTDFFTKINLEGIEPFTIILLQQFKLFECRWDGTKKFKRQLSTQQSYIWSSATLYNETVQKRREAWFKKWLSTDPQPTQAAIIDFHQFAGDGDEQNDIRMNRDGQLFTVSISGIQLAEKTGVMHYLDLKDGSSYSKQLAWASTENQCS